MASFQDPIDISDHINPDILYAAERTFQYARNKYDEEQRKILEDNAEVNILNNYYSIETKILRSTENNG